MADVLICHDPGDGDLARRLGEAIEREGYAVAWTAESGEEARAAIVLWSHAGAASRAVREAAGTALRRKTLVQVSFDDRLPPMPFNQIQVAALAGWQGEDDHDGWRKVRASLTLLCGGRDRS